MLEILRTIIKDIGIFLLIVVSLILLISGLIALTYAPILFLVIFAVSLKSILDSQKEAKAALEGRKRRLKYGGGSPQMRKKISKIPKGQVDLIKEKVHLGYEIKDLEKKIENGKFRIGLWICLFLAVFLFFYNNPVGFPLI